MASREANRGQQVPEPKPGNIDREPLHRRVEKPWGWETIWAESGQYTGKFLHVWAGNRLSLQYHDDKVETQCLLSGRAVLVIEMADASLQEIPMEIGKGYAVHPYQVHRLVAIEDSELVEVSTPERGTTVRLEDDFLRADETEATRSLPGRGWSPTSESP
jgi:mannose-6-phosphate isomerase